MRTTVEMSDEHRAKLLAIAGARGEKGFSRIVEEALDLYLEHETAMESARRRAARLIGALGEEEEQDLRRRVAALREEWR
jgi:hypothetical protein